ncbi:MAG: aromatic ring-hydroxylating dioxygenase subunit alpha [Sphingomonadaceae bacterium]
MNKVELEFVESPVEYRPFRPDDLVYPERHVGEGAERRNDKKQPYVDFGTDRHEDKERYTSRDVMEREWQNLWKKTWVIFGHINDLPEPGRFIKVDLGRESFIVVRQDDGSIKALYNVCQHRGTQLVTEDFGHRDTFTCPFHLWQFDKSGKCMKVTDRETFRKQAIDPYEIDIPEARVQEWKGWLFISMDKNAEPLTEFLGEELIKQHAAYPFEQMKRLVDYRQVWDVNWKVALEAFIEGYHLQAVHPQMVGFIDVYHIQIDLYDNGHAKIIAPYMRPSPQYAHRVGDEIIFEHKIFLRDAGIDPETFTGTWHDVRPAIIAAKRKFAEEAGLDFSGFDDEQLTDDWNTKFFPSATFNAHPEGVLLQYWWPHPTDPEKMIYYYQVYGLPDRELPTYMAVPEGTDRQLGNVLPAVHLETGDLEPLGPVLSQDAVFIPRVQSRMRSDGYRGGLYCEQEIGIRQFYAKYYEMLGTDPAASSK